MFFADKTILIPFIYHKNFIMCSILNKCLKLFMHTGRNGHLSKLLPAQVTIISKVQRLKIIWLITHVKPKWPLSTVHADMPSVGSDDEMTY
jgi:hypothetical protein